MATAVVSERPGFATIEALAHGKARSVNFAHASIARKVVAFASKQFRLGLGSGKSHHLFSRFPVQREKV